MIHPSDKKAGIKRQAKDAIYPQPRRFAKPAGIKIKIKIKTM
jgi:hypothetical protein